MLSTLVAALSALLKKKVSAPDPPISVSLPAPPFRMSLSAPPESVLAPDDPVLCDDLGYGYYLAGDNILARRFLTRALTLGPNLPLTQYHYGLLLVREGETRAARAAFEAAARLDPGGEVGALAARASEALPSP
jgi:tetratricopeptide (TPR) repeat protein